MNGASVTPDVRRQLQEAVREIQVMAGLTDLTLPQLRLPEPPQNIVGLPMNRGLKPARGAGASPADVAARLRAQASVLDGQFDAPRALAVGITSPDYRDGKTTIAISLASTIAHDFGAQVLLVDADFHTHSVGEEYGLADRRGLADVIEGTASLQQVTNRFRQAPLSVITAGTMSEDPARLSRSEQLTPIINQMKAMSGFVVLDLPATLHSMNAPVLANRCDAVIVVARAGHTTQRELERVLELLQDAKVIGVVLNRQRSSVPAWMDRLLALPR